MNKLGVLGIGLLALSTACSGGGSGGDSPTYSGKIIDWPATKTGSISVVTSGNSTTSASLKTAVDANGNFSNLAFPGLQAVTPTLPSTPANFCSTAGVTATPATTKVITGNLTIFNTAGATTGNVTESNRPIATISANPAVGDKFIFRVFADGNLKVSGACTSATSTVTYDMNFSSGWNVAVAEVTAVTGTTATTAKFYTGGLPGGINLYYTASGSNTLSIDNLFK